MESKRLDWVDICKGIGIILIMIGHRTVPFITVWNRNITLMIKEYVSSYHIPLFFFISGYLFIDGKYKTLTDYSKSKIKTIIIPYIFFSMISLILFPLINYGNPTYNIANYKDILTKFFYLKGEVLWNGPLWFLISLFVVSIMFFILNKFIKNKNVLLIFLIIFSILGYVISKHFNVSLKRLPFSLDNSLTALTFYGLGYYVKNSRFAFRKTYYSIILMFLCFIVGTYIALYKNDLINMSWNRYGNYFYFYIAALAGTYSVVTLSQNIKSKILSYLGKNTLVILGTHIIIYNIIDVLLKISNINIASPKMKIIFQIPITVLVTILISVPLISFLNKYLPFLIGKGNKLSGVKKVTLNN